MRGIDKWTSPSEKLLAFSADRLTIGVSYTHSTCHSPYLQDLKAMCRKYTSMEEDCVFTLHKENF